MPRFAVDLRRLRASVAGPGRSRVGAGGAAVTEVRALRFTPASRESRRTGLLGWVAFRLGSDWLVDGVAVRRTLGGEVRLSFPQRVDGAGRAHPFLLPACSRARRELERAVLAAIKEPLQGLGPAPGGAHIDAAAQGQEAEEGGAHQGQGTARGRRR